MSTNLGKSVKVKEISCQASLRIISYLGKKGTVKGVKVVQNISLPIVEFDDYTRIWVLTNEIEIL